MALTTYPVTDTAFDQDGSTIANAIYRFELTDTDKTVDGHRIPSVQTFVADGNGDVTANVPANDGGTAYTVTMFRADGKCEEHRTFAIVPIGGGALVDIETALEPAPAGTFGLTAAQIAVINTNNIITWEFKSADFLAEDGKGYFIDTTAGIVNVTAPVSPQINTGFVILDVASKFATNSCFVLQNGENIMNFDEDFEADLNNFAAFIGFSSDTTFGWRVWP